MNDLHFMPHQEDALNRTEQFNRCAYYLDMGLGKTFVIDTKEMKKTKGSKKKNDELKTENYDLKAKVEQLTAICKTSLKEDSQ